MLELGIDVSDLKQSGTAFQQLQREIVRQYYRVERQQLPASDGTPRVVVADRCALDAIAYSAWRFGLDSQQVRYLAAPQLQDCQTHEPAT